MEIDIGVRLSKEKVLEIIEKEGKFEGNILRDNGSSTRVKCKIKSKEELEKIIKEFVKNNGGRKDFVIMGLWRYREFT